MRLVMYIKRSIESVLIKRAKNSKSPLLTGSRQVGKSTLLKNAYKDSKYYTFDDRLLLSTGQADPKFFDECSLFIHFRLNTICIEFISIHKNIV